MRGMERQSEQTLCRVEDIPDGDSRGFLPNQRRQDRLFAVRRGAEVYVYLNTCPHNWVPLDWMQDKFMGHRGGDIVCFAHGAHFDVVTGECTAGVCEGQSLIPVPSRLVDGEVRIALPLPEAPE
jgi:nitrite reductase/ring-hydroxylating ferredoxin subunit